MKKTLLFSAIFFLFFYLAGQTSKEELLSSPYSEHYVKIIITEQSKIQDIGNRFSIDNILYFPEKQYYNVTVWLHRRDFADFLALDIPFEMLQPKQNDAKASMANTVEEFMNGWTLYPTYSTYEALMGYFQNTYPAICKIDTILTATPKGHKILAAHISTTLDGSLPKPKFFYSSTMHGDEAGGYYMMLRLIHYILSNQGDSKVNTILNSVDLWISPLENPDGTYHSGNNTLGASPVSTRANANGYDLNRSYPKAFTTIENGYQPEITAMMNFMNLHQFTMSANLHGGAELFNYVWDMHTTEEMKHPDADWWQSTGRAFADTCHRFAANYFTDEKNGVSNGGDWYVIANSRQDYVNYHARCREVTIEMSKQKIPNNSELNKYWNYIKNSLLNYILATHQGISGIVTDSLTGEPLQAKIFINHYDDAQQRSEVYSQLPHGDYYRPLLPKTYSVTYSADGYLSQTHTLSVLSRENTVKNVKLVKGETGIYDFRFTISDLQVYPNPTTGELRIENYELGIDNEQLTINNVEVYDVMGKKIQSKIVNLKSKITIDLSPFPTGIYWIKITTIDGERVMRKVVKL